MIKLFKKHMNDHGDQVQRYGLVGFLTAAIGLASFWLLESIGINANVANTVSVLLAVIFGFFTNKIFVFRTHSENLSAAGLELGRFLMSRTATILLEIFGFALLFYLIGHYELVIRGAVSGIVFVLNYIFSHMFVFHKTAKE